MHIWLNIQQWIYSVSAITIDPLHFHTYGLILGIAIIMTTLAFLKHVPITIKYERKFWIAIIIIVLSAILVGRIAFVLVNLSQFASHPLHILEIWRGGMTIFGVLTGGLIAYSILWLTYFKSLAKGSKNYFYLLDIMLLVLPLGQAIGRLGNFVNQELYGLPTNLPWKIFINPINRTTKYMDFQYFHPAFLYELILDLMSFAVLSFIFRKHQNKHGLVSAVSLINYGIIRLIMDRIRIDNTPVISFLSLADMASFVLILTGVIILVKTICQAKKNSQAPYLG